MRARRVVLAAVLAALGCSGGGENPVGPTEKGEVRFNIVGPTTLVQARESWPRTPISVVATGVYHTKGLQVSLSCTIDGQFVVCGEMMYVLPGTHEKCVTGGSTDGAFTRLCVNETIIKLEVAGRILAKDSRGATYFPEGVWVRFGFPGKIDSVQTGPDGTFVLNSPYVGQGNVPGWTDGTPDRMPWLVRTSAEFWTRPNPVIGPRFVMTPSCQTTGPSQRVNIDLAARFKPVILPAGHVTVAYFRRYNMEDGTEDAVRGPQVYQVGNWKDLPVRVAMLGPMSALDSVATRFALDSINKALCMEVVRVASKEDVEKYGGIKLTIRSTHQQGGVVGSRAAGDFSTAEAGVVSGAEVTSFVATVIHEVLHCFDLGHTEEESIMRSGVSVLSRITTFDVAGFYFRKWIRDAERENNSRFSLAQMHQGWLVAHALNEDPVAYVTEDGATGSVSNPTGPVSVVAIRN